MAKVLVIGSGGREHAICWKLSQSAKVSKIFALPGSYGIGCLEKAENINLDLKDFNAIKNWCVKEKIELVVVGPEDPLAGGLADILSSADIACFGPKASAAKIESDKAWSKDFMLRHGIPTARYRVFNEAKPAKDFIQSADYEALVVKPSGLTAGKGVVVAANRDEACKAVDMIFNKYCKANDTVVVEELLAGEEISVLGFSDGDRVVSMLPAQDHKRIFEGDKGNNTGGMGAYCPCPLISEDQLKVVHQQVLMKTVKGLKEEGSPFVGVLYAGLMLTKDGPKVLEFNCRFGDPETQVILPLLENDLFQVMMMCCRGELNKLESLNWKKDVAAVGVVMASKGYPESASKGDVITGLDCVEKLSNMIVFHSGVSKSPNGDLVTSGGRVLINVNISPSLDLAAAAATRACSLIAFPGAQFRRDIAHKGIPSWILRKGRMSYKVSGVDINAGEALVENIKPFACETKRSGVMDSLGGFGGMFSTKLAGYKDPILVSGADGVGTKLKIAFECGRHDTVGQDLVAMCANDILCQGAEPLFFLDYFACGQLNLTVAASVVNGIANACSKANCALIGGETAEMPGLYKEGEYDLGGFCVGAVESGQQLPKSDDIKEGDVLIGLESSGVHSNGFSLVRKVVHNQRICLSEKAPFSDKTLGEELLTPTLIYVLEVLPSIRANKVKALAHITGGGLVENIPRVLPKNVKAVIDANKWRIPPVFPWLAAAGGISEREMLRTFNCGIGMVLIADKSNANSILSTIRGSKIIGHLEKVSNDGKQVEVVNFAQVMTGLMKPYVKQVIDRAASKKRIGVLISGSGTNLQSLINGIQGGDIDGEIVIVISNKEGVKGITRAQNAKIPTKVISHVGYSTRQAFEEEIDLCLRTSGVELVVLAGFMRVLTGWFVGRWRGRLVNIHPALLPLFKGVNGPKQAIEAGVRVSGCTVHFVEEDVDAGAIIVQETVPVLINDTEESLQARIQSVERIAMPKAVQLICSGKVSLDTTNNKLIWS